MTFHSLEEAARLAGTTGARILELIRDGKVPATSLDGAYLFTDETIILIGRLTRRERTPVPKIERVMPVEPAREVYTAKQLAALWHVSEDYIRRKFENEPGVLVLGNRNPKGKQRYVMLRIPREVAERVQRRESNA